MMFPNNETFAESLARIARADGRTLRQAALAYGLPVQVFHSWATGRSLPSQMAIPRLALALGCDEQELRARVMAARTTRPSPAPRIVRAAPTGNPCAVAEDVRSAVSADAGLVREFVTAMADGKLDRAELRRLRGDVSAILTSATRLARDIDAAIAATDPPEVVA